MHACSVPSRVLSSFGPGPLRQVSSPSFVLSLEVSVSLSPEFPQLRVSDEVFLTRPCDVMSIMCALLESVFEWGDDVLQAVSPVLSKPRSLSCG